MNGKRILILAIALTAMVGLALLISRTLNKTGPTTSMTPSTSSDDENGMMETNEPLTATFRASSFTWQNQSSQHEVQIYFEKDPDPYPTAYTLQILFDPTILQIDSVNNGNLWTGENVLERKIDNDKGEVMFSVGQGFDEETTGDTLIATLTATVVNGDSQISETSLSLGPESATASVGVNHLINLQAPSVKIKLSE